MFETRHLFHPLKTAGEYPSQLNNPFDYEPHPLCRLAAEEVTAWIESDTCDPLFRSEAAEGKMFGVLVVRQQDGGNTETGYLAAYSGQIAGRSDWQGFVPAVFDYLQPDSYFKTHEAEINTLNHRIAALETDPVYLQTKSEITQLVKESQEAITRQKNINLASKMLRDRQRHETFLSGEEQMELIRESQFQKAELRRIKQRYLDEIKEKEARNVIFNQEIRTLERERKKKSRELQQWLFNSFELCDKDGNRRSLADIFANTAFVEPPSGAGECCEPKLLHYAFTQGWQPLAIAMFWYGKSPKTEIRHAGQFYPACRGKCKPILEWMLGKELEPSMPDGNENGSAPEVIYEDDDIIVINKPEGLLSVPGLQTRHSVFTIFKERYPGLDSPLVVHRLDQATSGLLLLAKTRDAYVKLQQQFQEHTVIKRYVAVLDGTPEKGTVCEGVISLPMRVDHFDRPRQVVDHGHGKPAVTEYIINKVEDNKTYITLYPKTGRTHQLRVHCAHPDGLGLPIIGDRLYGKKADRLYLHAEHIEFTHPTTGKRISFACPPKWWHTATDQSITQRT